ncbi:hypothetical protein SMSK597_0463 [Streptococcus mitis SK597]|uniref:Uncharacterized protein n=1 Tax=Streptococcus mitis SK597 TaxID=585204 RepID=E1LRR3_STRMT|nr:hypothetical protein SMSK597_0463 [Streptococcus mitis SK597]
MKVSEKNKSKSKDQRLIILQHRNIDNKSNTDLYNVENESTKQQGSPDNTRIQIVKNK